MAKSADSDALLLQLQRHHEKQRQKQLQGTHIHHKPKAKQTDLAAEKQTTEDPNIQAHLDRHPTLKAELEKYYGADAPRIAAQIYGSHKQAGTQLLQQLLQDRARDFAKTKTEQSENIRDLNAERQRLQIQRDNLKPSGGASSARSVHGVDSFITNLRQEYPAQLDKYHRLKHDFEAEYERLYKPYSGELGAQSYLPWQMADYRLARSIVEEVVDHFLDSYFRHPPSVSRDMQQALIAENSRNQEKWWISLAEQKNTQLIMEELVLTETRIQAEIVAAEYLELWSMVKARGNVALIEVCEAVPTHVDQGRQPEDPAYSLNTNNFHKLQRDRDKYRSKQWRHTQYVHIKGQEEEEEDKDEGDVTILDFHNITPSGLRRTEPGPGDTQQQREDVLNYGRYTKRESQHWTGFEAGISIVSLAKKCAGLSAVRFSHNHQMVALGTAHGDIIVYDMRYQPWRPIRVISNPGKAHDEILDIQWSLDNTKLVTVNQMGTMRVWSMSGGAVSKEDNRALDLRDDSEGVACQQLALLCSMDVDAGHFAFISGPLAELASQEEEKRYAPILAALSPSISVLATQYNVVVGLENGDILRVNLENNMADISGGETSNENELRSRENPIGEPSESQAASKPHRILEPQIQDDSDEADVVGLGVEAEMFREHRASLVLLGFIHRIGDMVTVDQKGYIFIWKYRRKEKSDFGWFRPNRKYRLDFSKMMYLPADNAKHNMIFSDSRKQAANKQKTRQQMALEREKAEAQIAELHLKDPWHEDNLETQGIESRIYKPDDVPEGGALFHTVMRHAKTQVLSTYFTKIFKPRKVKSTKFLCCVLSPTSTELVFVLLFPQYPPKDAQITVVVVELETMTLRDMRCDISLTDEKYLECLHDNVVSCDVSKQFGPTGASYLFLNIAGHLFGISLNTGEFVLRMVDLKKPLPDFVGCQLNSRSVHIHKSAEVAVAGLNGKFIILLYTHGQKQKIQRELTIIVLEDQNTEEERNKTATIYKMWWRQGAVRGAEERIDPVTYRVEEDDHAWVAAHKAVLHSMDAAVQAKTRPFSEEEKVAHQALDSRDHYRAVSQIPPHQGDLHSEPSNT